MKLHRRRLVVEQQLCASKSAAMRLQTAVGCHKQVHNLNWYSYQRESGRELARLNASMQKFASLDPSRVQLSQQELAKKVTRRQGHSVIIERCRDKHGTIRITAV